MCSVAPVSERNWWRPGTLGGIHGGPAAAEQPQGPWQGLHTQRQGRQRKVHSAEGAEAKQTHKNAGRGRGPFRAFMSKWLKGKIFRNKAAREHCFTGGCARYAVVKQQGGQAWHDLADAGQCGTTSHTLGGRTFQVHVARSPKLKSLATTLEELMIVPVSGARTQALHTFRSRALSWQWS